MHHVWLGPQEVGDTPMATLLCTLCPPLQNNEEERLPNGQGKTLQQDSLGHKGDVPNQGTPSPPRSSPTGE